MILPNHFEHSFKTALAMISGEEGKNTHRLLGAHRGVSQPLIDFAILASGIDWEGLREERF
jgi:hypothetical protein